MINGNHDVYLQFAGQQRRLAGWTPVGVGVGAVSVATGVIQTSQAPTFTSRMSFMMNTARDVYYKVRNANGSWSNWSPVGIKVGAESISATTIAKRAERFDAQHGRQRVHQQAVFLGGWLGWSPVGAGIGITRHAGGFVAGDCLELQ